MSALPDRQVLVAGAGAWAGGLVRRLRKAGVNDVLVLDAPVTAARFDHRSDLWWADTAEGCAVETRILIVGRPPSGVVLDGAFLGVAAHGSPNLFLITAGNQMPYIAGCVDLLARGSATRIEVRAAVQHASLHRDHRSVARALRTVRPKHFDLTSTRDRESEEGYRGSAVLASGDHRIPVTVALAGHSEPIDGRYHWYGRITADDDVTALRRPGREPVTLTLPEGKPVPAKLAEVDPWGSVRVTGVGPPPYRVESLEEIDATTP